MHIVHFKSMLVRAFLPQVFSYPTGIGNTSLNLILPQVSYEAGIGIRLVLSQFIPIRYVIKY